MAVNIPLKQSNRALAQDLESLEILLDYVDSNEDQRALFSNNPLNYLEKHNTADIICEANGQSMSFSSIIMACERDARVPVAKTLLKRLQMGQQVQDIDHPSTPQTVPFVNVVANSNLLINANFFANVMFNTNGMINANANMSTKVNYYGAAINESMLNRKCQLAVKANKKFENSLLSEKLDEYGYSLFRQQALAKTLIARQDPDMKDCIRKCIQCNYKDISFSLTYSINGDILYLLDANLVDVSSNYPSLN